MNRLISVSSKSISVYIPQVTNRFCVFFATAKPKTDASKAKSKKESKSEYEMDQKQLKSLLIHYYKMRTYEPPKLTPEQQEEYSKIAKEYSRQMAYLHHTAEKRLIDKIFLRDLAIAALPTEELRQQAMKIDTEQIPGKYFYPAKKARFEDLSKELAWCTVCLTPVLLLLLCNRR